MSLRHHAISFKHAIDGVIYILKTQPNFRVHTAVALAIIASGFYFHITQTQWLIIVFTICLVMVSEAVNTSIEAVTDLLTDEYHLQAKIAKDVSAGMVLLSAVASVIVGIIIFLPHL